MCHFAKKYYHGYAKVCYTPSPVDTILYIYLSKVGESTCLHLKFEGVRQMLKSRGFNVRKISMPCAESGDLDDLIDFWDAKGLVIDCRGHRPPIGRVELPRLPLVFLDVALGSETPSHASVAYDIRMTCRMAARELLSLDYPAYGYVGYGAEVPWSEERKRIFCKALSLNGRTVDVFDVNPDSLPPSAFYRKLSKWICARPKPLGIFAADDTYAVHLHSVVQNLDLRIPYDVAILGVDDDSSILSAPGLSSIQLDFAEAGRIAAKLLLDRIADPSMPPERRHFSPVQLLRRNSTRKLRRSSRNLAEVLQYIKEQAPHGLTAAQVAAMIPGSRRLAEMRFKEMTGHSILEEIVAARIDRAKELLANTGHSIGVIAELCGYRTFNAFRNAFKAQTGTVPRKWRKRK